MVGPVKQDTAAGEPRGFTLMEVMIALVVLAIGLTGAMQGITMGEASIDDANRRHDAMSIARTVYARLLGLSATVTNCRLPAPGDLLGDGNPNNSMLCFGSDANDFAGAKVNCLPDHPQNGDELNRVLGHTVGDYAGDQMLSVDETVGGGQLGGVRYRGQYYRVVWNVSCDLPIQGQTLVSVLVGWGDLPTAMTNSRFLTMNFVKSDSL